MGNIFGAPTPRPAARPAPQPARQPEPQRRAEYHRPRYQAPELLDIQAPPRNVRPANIGALQTPRCLHYTREICGQGNYCPFVHEGDALQRQTPRTHPNLQRPTLRRPIEENIPQARKLCRYFAQGRCYKGAQCRFSHEKNRATSAENQVWQFIIDSFSYIS